MPETTKADVIIVGGGGAGLAAAVTAAENGCKDVLVLETRGATGGTSAMASGIFGAESPAQRRQAIQAPKDEMFRRYMQWGHLAVNPRIIRAFVDLSGETVRWLEGKGLHFICRSHSPADNPMTWHIPDGDGAAIMKVLAEECRRLGVRIELKTTAKKLLKNDAGQICGVLAERDGTEVAYEAKNVIIAGGGFGGDVEKVKELCPKYRPGMGNAGVPNKGEGIFMALEAGAAPDGLGMLMAAGPVAGGGGMIRLGEEPNVVPINLTFITGEPANIWVNRKGRRFIDEMGIYNYYEVINALLRQPDAICYALFDARQVRRITERGLTNVASGFRFGDLQRSPLPEGLDKVLESKADGKFMKMGPTWAAIAEWIGVSTETLEKTVTEYNAGCEKGYDPVFGKDRQFLQPIIEPPFYAIRCVSTYLNTLGGIKVNEHMEALDKDHNPIPGLYAAGVDTGGWTPDTYCAALPGTAFGYAVNSGRIAGFSVTKRSR